MTIENILGNPNKTVRTAEGRLDMWVCNPLIVTRVKGHACEVLAREVDACYRRHYDDFPCIVTFHDWSKVEDFDVACRGIMSDLTKSMRAKQQEIIIHLGEPDSINKKILLVAASAIGQFTRLPIDMLSTSEQFLRRLSELKALHAAHGNDTSKWAVPLELMKVRA